MRAAEHVAFADDAGGHGCGVDARVEFGVGRRLEHFFQAAAGEGEDALWERGEGLEVGGGCCACGGDWRGGGRGWVWGWGDVDYERELVHEFVFAAAAVGMEAAEAVDHSACDAGADPDIAVDNPYDVAFGFAVASAHVADLGVRPEVVWSTISSREVGVFLFHQYFGIVIGEVCE